MIRSTDEAPLTGALLRGNLKLGPRLGQGSMGEVYLAEEVHLQRPVAVKVIRPGHAGDARLSSAFLNEARTISRLRHPNIVSLLDFGQTPDGLLYLVMEYIPGRPLSSAFALDGTDEPLRVVGVLAQVADALEVAHRAGVIHRDVKPDNILVEELPSAFEMAKLVDFGLAGSQVSEGQPWARGKVVGAPAYMSPEQARAENVTARSDVFGLGAVLMLVLTGRRVYDGATVRTVLRAAAAGDVLDPLAVAPRLSGDPVTRALAEVCRRATAVEPESRFASAAAMGDALRLCLEEPLRGAVLPFSRRGATIALNLRARRTPLPAEATLDDTVVTDRSRPEVALRDSWFDDTARGIGHFVEIISDYSRDAPEFRAAVQEQARRRGALAILPPLPTTACHVGEILTHALDVIEEHARRPLQEWLPALDVKPAAADLLLRYRNAWRYEATHPLLFEVSDAGLVLAFRQLVAALAQSVPLVLHIDVPDGPDGGLIDLIRSLSALRDTHPFLLIVRSPRALTHVSSELTPVGGDESPASARGSEGASREPVLVSLTRSLWSSARAGHLDEMNILLGEVGGAVPIEYLGDTAIRVLSGALARLPTRLQDHGEVRAHTFALIRACVRARRMREAGRLLDSLGGVTLAGAERLAYVALRARVDETQSNEFATANAFAEIRQRLASIPYPPAARLEALALLLHYASRFRPDADFRAATARTIVATARAALGADRVSTAVVHRSVDALDAVLEARTDEPVAAEAAGILLSLLDRALPPRVELDTLSALITMRHLAGAPLPQPTLDRLVSRGAEVTERLGDPAATLDLQRNMARISRAHGNRGEAVRRLYRAARTCELLRWQDRLAEILDEVAQLAAVDESSAGS